MTEAILYRSKDGLFKGFSLFGHANARKRGEYDLVCAAVSAVGFTIVGSLETICQIRQYHEEDGELVMMLPGDLSREAFDKAQIILETLKIGLKQIERQYPRHLRVLDKEV